MNHHTVLALGLAVLISPPLARPQWVTTGLNALDVPVDPRTIALGESFVALPGNDMALMENVAGLAGLRGVGVTYAQRQLNWLNDLPDSRYHAAAAHISTSIGTFGVLYNRLNFGEAEYSSFAPEHVRIESHNQLLALGFARALTGRLIAGITLKGYDQVQSVVEGNPGAFRYETEGAFLVDLGLLYTFPELVDLGPLESTLRAGISVQNFGTDFREKVSYTQRSTDESLVKLPHYARIGVCYTFSLQPVSEDELVPFALILTGEYRRLLNPSENQVNQNDFWGFGTEISLLEIVSVRMGGVIQPYTSIYGSRGVPALRYGIGATIPFQKLGVDAPVRITLDYAGIPLTDRSDIFGTSGIAKSTLRAFSLHVATTDALF